MATLLLNNWRILLNDIVEQTLEIGSMDRAFSGKMRRMRRALKRQWSVRTTAMLQEDARAMEGMLLALGDAWPAETDAFSAKGMAPLANNGITAVTGAGRYGNAFWPRGASTNLFASNIATGTETSADTSGFVSRSGNAGFNSAINAGAILTSSTGQAWQGTRSLLVQMASEGIFGSASMQAACSPSTTYTFSCYIRPYVGSVSLMVFAYTNGGGGGQSTATLCPNGAWTRLVYTFTTGASATILQVNVGESIDVGYQFYMDGIMIEPAASASAWVAQSAPGVDLVYDVFRIVRDASAVTVGGWLINPTASGVAWRLAASAGTAALLFYYSAGQMRAAWTNATGASTEIAAAWATPTTYAHWAIVLSNTGSMALYLNGILQTTGMRTGGSVSALTRLQVGNNNATAQWKGYIDEPFIWPYAASSAQLAALATMPQAPSLMPQMQAQGDVMLGIATPVIASEVRTNYLHATLKQGWRNNAATLQFTLSEC